jgi:hypothetical protein
MNGISVGPILGMEVQYRTFCPSLFQNKWSLVGIEHSIVVSVWVWAITYWPR